MSIAAAVGNRHAVPAFLSMGFRPFFLAAGIWAVAAQALWIAMLMGGISPPTRFDPVAWHVHEMLFGVVMASVAGFLLTAIPNWTNRPPVAGMRLVILLGSWLLGRAVCLCSAWMPAWIAAAADLIFPALLLIVASREIIAAKNWRNLPVLAPVGLFGVSNALMHLQAMDIAIPPGLGWRLGITSALILISIIAGRIVPAFTRNWLARQGSPIAPGKVGWMNSVALGILHAGLLGWAIWPGARLSAYGLIAGGIFNAWRLAGWRGATTVAEPLLLILHIAYAWLVLGVTLLGIALLTPMLPMTAAIHALTAGAIVIMILGVMTRVSLGHSGRALTADRATAAIYALATLAAVTRIAAAFAGTAFMTLVIAAAIAWIAAFGLFCIVYGRIFLTPRRT